jgi:hypothetical protein
MTPFLSEINCFFVVYVWWPEYESASVPCNRDVSVPLVPDVDIHKYSFMVKAKNIFYCVGLEMDSRNNVISL